MIFLFEMFDEEPLEFELAGRTIHLASKNGIYGVYSMVIRSINLSNEM